MSILRFREANCKNCYRCVRSCPVKAIAVTGNQAQVIGEECVLCGKCLQSCPQNAKMIRSDIQLVRDMIGHGEKVYVCLSAACAAVYGADAKERLAEAFYAAGFSGICEEAEGAAVVRQCYEQMLLENPEQVLITSACPTVVMLAQKHYPDVLPYVAKIQTPAVVSAQLVKERNPGCKVVLLSPCLSAKQEAGSEIDVALTVEEWQSWMQEDGIELPKPGEKAMEMRHSRLYAVSGGMIDLMQQIPSVCYFPCSGIASCIRIFEEVRKGALSHCFLELSACRGGCVNGPCRGKCASEPVEGRMKVLESARAENDFALPETISLQRFSREMKDLSCAPRVPTEEQIEAILRQMGKFSPEDEPNCGICGYSTCREKAEAVFFGRAEISMCLPYMKERAASLTGKVFSLTPHAIIVADAARRIMEMNVAAKEMFGVYDETEWKGRPISALLEGDGFLRAMEQPERKIYRKGYLSQCEKYADQTYVYDKKNGILLCFLKDITEKVKKKEKIAAARVDAAEITDEIVEKQMRIVHEIASLLGETAAETKIALTELKGTILLEDEEEP